MRSVVIGGGAAGFFGAVTAALAHPAWQVTLLEAGPAPLSKVRISGGGRCNVTHHCFDPALLVQHYPRGGKALRGAFSRFQPQDTIAWFAERGVLLKTEADGRMFPTTDDSHTIVSCLMQAAQEAGVRVRTRSPVAAVTQTQPALAHPTFTHPTFAHPTFDVQLKSGERLGCDRVLLATGSSPQGHRIAQSLGHRIEPPVPSLFTFNIKDAQLHDLKGLSVTPATLKLKLEGIKKPLEQTGPLLITHWGLSGPAVLKLSAWGARPLHQQRYRATVLVNWLPTLPDTEIRAALQQIKQVRSRQALTTHSLFDLPKRLWQYLLHRSDLDPQLTWANLSKKGLNRLVQELTNGTYAVAGKGVFKDEFVTCGGVRLKDVNFKTMESRRCPGLFFAGEVLDIDGITGGFNFQSAWTTGWLAGQSIGTETMASKTAGSIP
ncbi:MAG: NAD(P)/FAD-dependent oxidoreductase [Cyanobacteria bacterium P01_A01_bin.105]